MASNNLSSSRFLQDKPMEEKWCKNHNHDSQYQLFTKRSILNFILHVLSTFPAYYESNINATITLNDIFGIKIINETENYNHLNYIIIGEALHPKTALSSKQCGACKRCVMYSQASAKQSPLRV